MDRPSRPLAARFSFARRHLARIVLCAFALCTAVGLWQVAREPPRPAAPQSAGPPPAASSSNLTLGSPPTPPAIAPPSIQHAGVASIEVIVGRNDTLDAIFRRLALSVTDLATIRQLPGIRQSLDYLKPGDAIQVTHAEGAVQGLTRKVSETQTLEVVRDEAGFAAKMVDHPVETRIRSATATISSSLFESAEAAQVSDAIALKLAEIFAWDIDFVLDIREGDRFTAVYEQIYQDGKYLRDGDILAAEFVNNDKVYRAVRYVNEAGVAGYYSPAGQPMRKAFLRAPVEFTRVSSVFNPHRRHPILNLIRGHMGTDYAAPIGTPVHAAGDGRVAFAGTRGGYGNALVIEHGSHVATLYGHLSHFARHLRVGSRVQQGEVIAYVGMTGLATGPHLHYEYLVNGVHKDPQKVHLPGAEPLQAASLQDFRLASGRWLALLDPRTPESTAAAAAEAAGAFTAPSAVAATAPPARGGG
ncbi:MAG TPA: peptidoglycan DD-metalloendopeptidase family protein [Steroidobacteraceae bacterium]|nr:peptidoglycan DD-metalloendopeptidase family protein [Steroidobacteraceae bacterium]